MSSKPLDKILKVLWCYHHGLYVQKLLNVDSHKYILYDNELGKYIHSIMFMIYFRTIYWELRFIGIAFII